MANDDNLLKEKDTYASVLGNEYNIFIESEDGGPIPKGSLYIFLRRICMPDDPIYRCKKHTVDGNQNIITSHTKDALPAKVKMLINGRYLLGLQWNVGNSNTSKEECKISFECTNYDVSRALLDRRWRLDIRKASSMAIHEIVTNFQFVTVHRKLQSAIRVFRSFPPPPNRSETHYSVTPTKDEGTQTDKPDPTEVVESNETKAKKILNAIAAHNDQFTDLLSQYQTIHQDMVQLRESISYANNLNDALITLPDEQLPNISDLSYVDFEELINM